MTKILSVLITAAFCALPFESVSAKTCKQMDSCAEAVADWCGGHPDRDRDNDGIPCEGVCNSREQTMREQEAIGCEL